MTPQYAPVFWGLLIVVLDFKINGFDLIVDGIGYALIALGCGGLAPRIKRFASASAAAWTLAALWACGLAVSGGIVPTYSAVFSIANCFMHWQLLGGVGDHALSQGRPDLDERARLLRALYVGVIAANFLLVNTLGGGAGIGALAVVLVVSGLLVAAFILRLIHRAKRELSLS